MNKQMIDTLIEIDKQMKEAQEQISDYIIKQTEENTWVILDENGKVIDTITKDTVIDYCKRECKDNDTCSCSAEIMTDSVWWYVNDNHNLELVDPYCQEWDKFTAWFDYICIEYLAKEIVAFYKQRLLDFE